MVEQEVLGVVDQVVGVQKAPARLGAGEQGVGDPPVGADAVALRGGAVVVVVELVEAGDLGRLQRLVGGQRRADHLERRGAEGDAVGGGPGHAELGIDPLGLDRVGIVVRVAEAEGGGDAVGELEIAVAVDVAVMVVDAVLGVDQRVRDRC